MPCSATQCCTGSRTPIRRSPWFTVLLNQAGVLSLNAEAMAACIKVRTALVRVGAARDGRRNPRALVFPDSRRLRDTIGTSRFPGRRHRTDPAAHAVGLATSSTGLRPSRTVSFMGILMPSIGIIYKRSAPSSSRKWVKAPERGSRTICGLDLPRAKCRICKYSPIEPESGIAAIRRHRLAGRHQFL
jgi:hypothetical protein